MAIISSRNVLGASGRVGLRAAVSTRRPVRSNVSTSVVASLDAGTVATIARWTLAAPSMYALVSANEYVAHRYYQHAEFNSNETLKAAYCMIFRKETAPKIGGGGHVEHHAETLDDMSLKTDPTWTASAPAAVLSDDPYRGTAFSYATTRLMLAQMFLTCTPVLLVMGFSPAETAALIVASTGVHGLIWNALHPAMHGLPDVPALEGLPSSWMIQLRDSAYFKFLYQNHEGHHVGGGRCNYNVCCPLVDHLAGTYVPEEEWRPRARLPERETPRPQYVAGEYAANLKLQEERAKLEGAVKDAVVPVA